MKILIAEDDPIASRLLESKLVKWSYEVVTVSNGREALEMLRSEDSPQMAILDWMMPEVDGPDVCREIRKLKRENYTYIFLLTTKGQKEHIIEGLRAGADDYIIKPFDAYELELRLNTGKRIIEQEEKLYHQALYDQLTSLPNRVNFLTYLGRMLKRTKWRSDYMFAVLFIDLDRFKVVNDSLGHLIGDKLLVEVARRLDACVRPTDRISRIAGNDRVARFGGDEFALFLNDIKDLSSASRVADRIQMELQKPFIIDGHELYTSASIGIALSATEYENEEDILRDADSAMYHAKATGRAHAEIFDDDMHARVSQILQIQSDLRTAVEKEQFMVYYQPVVSVTDSRITGAEALIRWNHPEQGFIPPLDFIPIAEETGLISAIGEWVLRTACAQNKAWQDAGYPNLLMKVNFSSRQFKDENLTEMVKKVIRETNMPAQLLDIEITESIAMEKSSIRILNQMTAMGLQTSIDDFGTGYSSLGSLTRFPINTIKIDRAFIKDITIDVNAEAIIRAIIAMAHSLNMEVVAEGVETEDQLAFLQSQKCDKIQGYLFSPPVPGEEFRKLLEKEKNGSPHIKFCKKGYGNVTIN